MKSLRKTMNQKIMGDKENTITVMEGENKVAKVVKVNRMKFNVMAFGRKKGSKILHKIKILMLKGRSKSLLYNRRKYNMSLKKIWNLNRCLGTSKLKKLFH